ncbi:hypothetical protein [Desulfovirgula thermocuniculi]|uniref:hypothetical protein n=1 Tax=Desulfovirgula thermocuniculi TaxID=348842 RepID=UPI00040E3756|nr:hypothetical protein [Desulfovirgula thermocuniculi]
MRMRRIPKRTLERALNLPPRRERKPGEDLVRALAAMPEGQRAQAVEALERAWQAFWQGTAEGGARCED